MENYEGTSAFEAFELRITQQAQDFLKTAAGWGLFLSIVGFLGCGLGLLGSLGMFAAGSAMEGMPGMPGATMGGIFLVGTLVMIIPVLYLFKFSSGARQALSDNNTEQITKSFGNLKGYFVWSGILTIVWIVLYFVLILSFAATGFSNM